MLIAPGMSCFSRANALLTNMAWNVRPKFIRQLWHQQKVNSMLESSILLQEQEVFFSGDQHPLLILLITAPFFPLGNYLSPLWTVTAGLWIKVSWTPPHIQEVGTQYLNQTGAPGPRKDAEEYWDMFEHKSVWPHIPSWQSHMPYKVKLNAPSSQGLLVSHLVRDFIPHSWKLLCLCRKILTQ